MTNLSPILACCLFRNKFWILNVFLVSINYKVFLFFFQITLWNTVNDILNNKLILYSSDKPQLNIMNYFVFRCFRIQFKIILLIISVSMLMSNMSLKLWLTDKMSWETLCYSSWMVERLLILLLAGHSQELGTRSGRKGPREEMSREKYPVFLFHKPFFRRWVSETA